MTQMIRQITTQEKQTIMDVVNSPTAKWEPHVPPEYMDQTALKDGRTVHIKFYDNHMDLMPQYDHAAEYPALVSMMSSICEGAQVGRAYIHRLRPGNVVLPHVDGDPGYFDNVQARYQIYLGIPEGAYLMLDGAEQDASTYEDTLVDLSYQLLHQYRNDGSTDWVFMVFDALNSAD
jgi:hypothetical protein